MQITAKLVELLPLQTGVGKAGEWKKQEIIVQTDGQYPKKVCISIWGDKINEKQLQLGNVLKLDVELESRSYNNKWYTDVKAWKVEVVSSENAAMPQLTPFEHLETEDDDTGLPF